MEATIKKLLSLDKEADAYRRSNIELLNEQRKELELYLNKMREEAEKKTSEEKQAILCEKLNKAKIAAEQLRQSKEMESRRIKETYEKVKPKIIEEIFVKLVTLQ